MAITNLFDAIFGQDRFKSDPNRPPSLMNFDEFGTKGAPTQLQQRQEQRQSQMVGDVTSKLLDPFIYQYEKASRPPVQYQEGQAVQDVASQNIMPNIAGVMGEGAKMVKGFAQEPIETTANLTKTVGTLGSGLAQKLTGADFDPNSVEIVDSVINEMANTYNDRYGTLNGFREAFAENPEQVIADATLLGFGVKGGTQLLKGVYDRVTDKQFVNNVIDRVSDLKVPIGMSISPRKQSPMQSKFYDVTDENPNKLSQVLMNDNFALFNISGQKITMGNFRGRNIYKMKYAINDPKKEPSDPNHYLGETTLMQDADTGQILGLIEIDINNKRKGSGKGLIQSFGASDPELFARDFVIEDIDASAIRFWEKVGAKRFFDNDPIINDGVLIDTDDIVKYRRDYDMGGVLNEAGDYERQGGKVYSVLDLDHIPASKRGFKAYHGTMNDIFKIAFGKELGNYLGKDIDSIPKNPSEPGVHFGPQSVALNRLNHLKARQNANDYQPRIPIKEGEGMRMFEAELKVDKPLVFNNDLRVWTPHTVLNDIFNKRDELPKGFTAQDIDDYENGNVFARVVLEDPDTGQERPLKVYLTNPLERDIDSINRDASTKWEGDSKNDTELNDGNSWEEYINDLIEEDGNYQYTFNDLSHELQSEWMDDYLRERGYDHIKYNNTFEAFDNEVGQPSYIIFNTDKIKDVKKESWAQMIAPLGGIDAMMGETPEDVPTEDDIPRQGLL